MVGFEVRRDCIATQLLTVADRQSTCGLALKGLGQTAIKHGGQPVDLAVNSPPSATMPNIAQQNSVLYECIHRVR
jgi:hypothetical protein